MTDLRIETTRGDLVESVHRVSAAVVAADGRLRAQAGNPELVTFWRSAAKPFQAMAMVADGAAARFALDDREVALACASHSSEPIHLAIVERMLEKIGCQESDLACGGHIPFAVDVAERLARSGTAATPRWSNCSGKHTAMLALAKVHGWPTAGYHELPHPVQQRLLTEVARWSGLATGAIHTAVDGCNTVCYGLPLRAMATAYAALGRASEAPALRIRTAMTTHPDVVAGSGRLCTDLMRAAEGAVIAKVGAEGVYGAAILPAGIGIALKVEDGGARSAPIALVAVLAALGDAGVVPEATGWVDRVASHGTVTLNNTRELPVGVLRAAGRLRVDA